ncbi:MAG: LysM peptidoglycan-binding domain-containing protein [Anaerolineae bacterium]|nr:LysM peptidoglycan-binding domain-containing protein [Anaerolineae bacterium]
MGACIPEDDETFREPTPTAPLATSTVTLSPTASPTASVTPLPLPPSATFPPTLTPSPPATEAPPTDMPPTPTPLGPFQYSIQPGDDCLRILFRHGHRDNSALFLFYELNDLPGRCVLGPPGTVVQVPRPVLVGEGGEIIAIPSTPTPPGGWTGRLYEIGQYCAEEGDTLTSIALKNFSTNRQICELNPPPDGLNCTGCDFSVNDIGFCPNPPLIRAGQCLNIPVGTPTPSPTAFASGDETPTPTPTYRPPTPILPAEGSRVEGAVRLQWVSVGFLQPNEYYVVEIQDAVSGNSYFQQTKSTSLLLPTEWLLTQEAQFQWRVQVNRLNSAGLLEPIGVPTPLMSFTWQR